MLITIANDHAFAPVLEITQLEIKNFPRPKTAMQHQENQSLIPLALKRSQQLINLLSIHRAWNPLDHLGMDGSSDRALPGSSAQEWMVPLRNMCQRRIIYQRNGILALEELIGKDEIFIKRGDSREDPIDRRRREPGCRRSLFSGSREHKAKSSGLFATRNGTQVFQECECLRGAKLLIGALPLIQKSHKM